MRKYILGSILIAASLSTASATELPDGTYDCALSWNMHLGYMVIEGDRYKGPSFDNASDSSYPFELTSEGTINWGGPLGGMSSGGNTVVSSVLKDAGGGTIGFDIIIRTERDTFQTVSCSPT